MPNYKPYIILHFIIFIWGFTAVLATLIQLDYYTLAIYRMGLSSLFLLLYIFIFNNVKEVLKINYKNQLKYLLGGVLIALHWIAFFYAIKISNVSITLLAMSSGAFFTSLIEPIFYYRKVQYYEILLGILIMSGFLFLVKVEHFELVGIVAALIAAFLSGLFSVLNGLYVKNQSAVQLSFFQLFYGFLFLLIVRFFLENISTWFFPLWEDWIYLIILASVCTSYAFTHSISLMKNISPYTLMLSINLEPVYGIVLAVFILGDKEKMSKTFYVGAVIILIIILLNIVIKFKKKKYKKK